MDEKKITLEYILNGIELKFNVSENFDPTTDIFDDMAEFLAHEHSILEDEEDYYSTLDKLDILVRKAKYYYLEYYKKESKP
ncbi:hypothetical protein MKS83_14495 [Chryseobacterium sp. Y16C]|uniref:hypothetical protein n=1 Tax=Chryseobacterium sp. Y16C TaxID=2920939 RepID=UPI001F0AD513|nr:hypothetical protein [Chryseobacterium sp. Y16C]UMQ40604.1 hypothetical protein MKS83_14495 [Chryseobacterium sp. Y16C]